MKLSIHHETHYEYSTPLHYSLQSIRLTPQASAHQTVHEWSVHAPGQLFPERDGYGNAAHTWTLAKRTKSGAVRATGLVETHPPSSLVDEPGALPHHVYLRETKLTPDDPELAALGRECLRRPVDAAALLALADVVLQAVKYRAGVTNVHTNAREALALGAGVCQDQAHVYIAACRANGLAARYVSGYFYAADTPELASHAWADVCVDLAAGRWLSVDVTHRCMMDERHVRLAVGPDYAACLPIRGVRSGGGIESMRVRLDIRPT